MEEHKKTFFENKFVILIIFLVLFLSSFYFRYSSYEGKINHDFPISINAGDPNSRLSEAEWVKESNSYDKLPPWFSENKNIAQHYAPILIILPAALSQITGLEVYDMFYFVGVLVSLGIAISFYILFKKFFNNETVALVLAFLIYFPYESIYHYQINIGMYGNYFTALFYPLASIFLLNYLQNKKISNLFFLTLMFVFQYYVHASEAVVFAGFVGLYILIFEIKNIKFWHIILMAGIFLIMILPHLPLLYYSWVTSGHGIATITPFVPINPPAHEPQFDIFGLLIPPLYILFAISLVFLIKNTKYRLPIALFVFFITITFILGLLGIGTYYVTIRTRYLLFVFMYPVVALGIGLIINGIEKMKGIKEKLSKNVLTIFVLLLILITTYFTTQSIAPSGSLITKEMYDGFLWTRQNVPQNADIMCFGCYQFEGLSTHKIIYQPNYFDQETMNQLVELSQNKIDNFILSSQYSGYRDNSPVKKNFFVYETTTMQSTGEINVSLCDVDYYIIKPYGQFTPVLIGIGQRLNAKNATVTYQNQNIIIMKNNNKGKECI